jgi:hypothetical protein
MRIVTESQPTSLFEYARKRVGFRRSVQVFTFMVAWDHARRAMRHESITLDEYADWWKVSRSTAFREQSRFREVFPAEATPDRILDLAAAAWDERTGVQGLGRVQLPQAQLAL